MLKKKISIALGAAIVAGACVYIASRGEPSSEPQRNAVAANREGVLNPEQSAPRMTSQPMPQLSKERFEPPPTISTGSYTDPKYRKPSDQAQEPSR